jgi:SAM-dependent methyltransferase
MDFSHSYFCQSCNHSWLVSTVAEHTDYSLKGNRNFDIKIEERKNSHRQKILLEYGWSHGTVLELGCAEGRLAKSLLAQKVLPPKKLIGVEPSNDGKLSQNVFDRIYSNVRDIPKDQFDLIYAFHVLEHIENPRDELQHIHSLLDHDGTLVIEVPNRSGSSFLAKDFNPEHIHSFSIPSVTSLLESSHFSIQHLKTGFYESPVYDDGILIACKKQRDPKKRILDLLWKMNLVDEPIVLAGLGNDFKKFIAPILGELNILGVYDRNPKNSLTNFKNLSLNDLKKFKGNILITSFSSGPAIKKDILDALGSICEAKLVTLQEILE